ncbi:MAG: VOC family protein [Litorimonas sp.]
MTIPVNNVFHVAIGTHDKELAKVFYRDALGGVVAREYDDRVTFNLFEHQLVCHIDEDLDPKTLEGVNPLKNPYPRHFGMTFLEESQFREVHARLTAANVPFLQNIRSRFRDLPEKHLTFFTADPSHNVVEFKWYSDSQHAY